MKSFLDNQPVLGTSSVKVFSTIHFVNALSIVQPTPLISPLAHAAPNTLPTITQVHPIPSSRPGGVSAGGHPSSVPDGAPEHFRPFDVAALARAARETDRSGRHGGGGQ